MGKWTDAAEAKKCETRQAVYDALNQGQRQKILKDKKVKALFDLYGVYYGEG